MLGLQLDDHFALIKRHVLKPVEGLRQTLHWVLDVGRKSRSFELCLSLKDTVEWDIEKKFLTRLSECNRQRRIDRRNGLTTVQASGRTASLCEFSITTNSLFFIDYDCVDIYWLFKTHCLWHFVDMFMFVMLLVLRLLVIQCGCHCMESINGNLFTYLL